MKGKRFCHFVTFACVSVMLVAASCEKMKVDSDETGDGQANIVLRVGSIDDVPFGAATRAGVLSEVCSRLNFLIYDDSGTRIRQVNQTIDNDGFGQAAFYVPKGRYFLTVLAHSSNGNPTSTNARKIGFTNKTGFTDTFLYADSLTVGNSNVEKTVELKRIVAMVRFIPYDAVPADADSIRFYYTGGSGTLDASNDGWGSVNSTQTQWAQLSHDEQKFEIYTIPHDDADSLKVEVSTYAAGGVLSTENSISGIPVKRNRITVCRGYLFAPVYGLNLNITIDDVWDTDTINFQF